MNIIKKWTEEDIPTPSEQNKKVESQIPPASQDNI